MPGAASAATSEERESVGQDDVNKSKEAESRSASQRASKELRRVTAQGEPVWASEED